MTDDPLTTCEDCGGSLRRVLQPVGIVFKGSGFYVTDYKRSDNGSTNTPVSSGKSESGESKPAAETPAKPATDTAAKKDPAPAAAAAS